ncbi:MAG: CPXCG motif-containing cysteine-rich protein [Chlamydiota bacterium]|nr:CPXCG motif-containing cysteine-rich protein [Chlamydiota bacterium]
MRVPENPVDLVAVQCPYCWEKIEIFIDLSSGPQEYIEDCSVCCKPMQVLINPARGKRNCADIRAIDD